MDGSRTVIQQPKLDSNAGVLLNSLDGRKKHKRIKKLASTLQLNEEVKLDAFGDKNLTYFRLYGQAKQKMKEFCVGFLESCFNGLFLTLSRPDQRKVFIPSIRKELERMTDDLALRDQQSFNKQSHYYYLFLIWFFTEYISCSEEVPFRINQSPH